MKRAIFPAATSDVHYRISHWSNLINIKNRLASFCSISLLLDTMFWRICYWPMRNFTNRYQVTRCLSFDGACSFSRQTYFAWFKTNLFCWISHILIHHVVFSSYSACLTCFPFCFVYPSDTFKDFKSEIHRLFPLIHDTKFIAFEIRRNPVSPCGNIKLIVGQLDGEVNNASQRLSDSYFLFQKWKYTTFQPLFLIIASERLRVFIKTEIFQGEG